MKKIDILTIGDTTTDAFIRLKEAEVHCNVNHADCEICLPFGGKVPFEYVKVITAAGNAANAAVAAARLGLRTALVATVGDDQNGIDCISELQKNNVVTTYVRREAHKATNYHFVLWYNDERTILTNHVAYDYRLPDAFDRKSSAGRHAADLPPSWIYLTSMASNATHFYDAVADYLDSCPETKLAFQPGTLQIRMGAEVLKRLYLRADVLIVNKEEAEEILGHKEPRRVTELLPELMKLGPKLVAITDGRNGAYLYDGDHAYEMPIYPDPRPAFERTGCGDAWSSTFVSSLALGHTPLEALVRAPINPMSVAQFIGSREGLLDRKQLEWWLDRAPVEYKPKEISLKVGAIANGTSIKVDPIKVVAKNDSIKVGQVKRGVSEKIDSVKMGAVYGTALKVDPVKIGVAKSDSTKTEVSKASNIGF